MELHSYAKRRATKKWTIEQKRKLVEARIRYDSYFQCKPTTSVLPWKKVVNLAKLDDYNVFFVRRQWSSMVAKYKQYKQNRIGNVPTKLIDNDMIEKITQEWEFFAPIHRYMTQKTTNLHSYALRKQQEMPPKTQQHLLNEEALQALNEFKPEAWQQPHSYPRRKHVISSSSDTNDDSPEPLDMKSECTGPNIDHDSYSKKFCYFADASEDTQESLVIERTVNIVNGHEHNVTNPIVEVQAQFGDADATTTVFQNTMMNAKLQAQQQPQQETQQVVEIAPVELYQIKAEAPSPQEGTTTDTQMHRSERDKYYRHKRRFNRRLERRFDSLLNVFGQIIRTEYPSIDVTPLLGAAGAGSTYVAKLFSSDTEAESDEEGSTSEEQKEHDGPDGNAK